MSHPPGPTQVSLAAQLFRRIILLLAAIILVVGLMMFWTAEHQINQVYDSQLITGANVLRALMSDEIQERSATPASTAPPMEIGDEWLSQEDRKAFDAYADWRMFRIWMKGQLVLGSDTGPKLDPPTARQEGFQTLRRDGKAWRIFNLPIPDVGVVVQVGERTSIRSVFINQILLDLALPLALLIPASLALVWLSLTDGLQALRSLVAEIGRRGSDNLRPVDAAVPRDLLPLASSVNDLLRRLEESREHERRFVDNAAHQLRTPLAALSLQAQLIEQEHDPAERAVQMAQMRAGVARAAELNEKLLTLARLGPHVWRNVVTDLREEVAAVLTERAVVAAAEDIALALEGEAPPVAGDPALVRLVLSNLIENAMAYAPPGSEIQVVLSADEGHGRVVVSDNGPGIPAEERERVFERFYRGVHASGSGSGLGLAIVEEAAGLMGGVVTLGDRADGKPGLAATLSLSRAET